MAFEITGLSTQLFLQRYVEEKPKKRKTKKKTRKSKFQLTLFAQLSKPGARATKCNVGKFEKRDSASSQCYLLLLGVELRGKTRA